VTPPRVLIVSHTYAAPINRAKLAALAQHVTLTALIPNRWRDELFDLPVDTVESASYELHRLPVTFNGHILRYFYSLNGLKQILQQVQPNLVYVEEEPASLALGQLAFLKRRFSYKLVFFTWENIQRRRGLPGLKKYSCQRCDGAIAGNNEAAQIIQRQGFRGLISVTPQLGLDPEVFKPARTARPEQSRRSELRQSLGLNQFTVGYVGRLVEAKGLWTLLQALGELPNVQLLIVGAGPLRPAMEQWMSQHGLNDRIRLVPAVPHAEIVRYLNTLDVLVLPSRTTPNWKEQFGHVLIEAMACGVPVIGSNSGAIPEVIAEAGLIFPEGDAGALREALLGLQQETSRRERLGQVGRERVLAHYTHAHIAAANAAFFDQVLNA
jgi:glycosyltransferase involved in cell wall biosynthesis